MTSADLRAVSERSLETWIRSREVRSEAVELRISGEDQRAWAAALRRQWILARRARSAAL